MSLHPKSWVLVVLLALSFFILLTATTATAAPVLTLQSSVGTTSPTTKAANVWVRGRYACSETTPCAAADLLLQTLAYKHFAPRPQFVIKGAIILFSSNGKPLADPITLAFTKDATDETSYTLSKPLQLLTPATPITEHVDFIIDLQRTRTGTEAHVSALSVAFSTMEAPATTELVTTKDTFYFLPNWSTPEATALLGPQSTGKPNEATPYDDVVHLDVNLGWNWWENFGAFDKIWIKPVGFGYLHNDINEYECLFAGNIISDLEIIYEHDDAETYYLEMRGFKQYTSQFNFDTPSRLQVQCQFPNKNAGETQPARFDAKWSSYSVVLGPEGGEIDDAENNFAVWFAPTTNTYQSPLHVITANKTYAIGNTPAYSLQSRFVLIDKQKEDRKYMSYYFVSFPFELPEDYVTKRNIVYSPKNFKSFLQLQINGRESVQPRSTEYAQFFLTCIHQTMHPTLQRSYIIAHGEFDYTTRRMSGPVYPAGDVVHNTIIDFPKVQYNNKFKFTEDGLDPSDGLPQCMAYSFDIAVGIYNDFNIKNDIFGLNKMYNVTSNKEHPTSLRLFHMIDSTVSLRHDFTSSFSDSALDNKTPVQYNNFEVTKVRKTKENKVEYVAFDMELSTKGLIKTSNSPMDATLPFTFHIISGMYQFKLDSNDRPNISCNIEYGSVKSTLPAFVVSDRRMAFEIVEEEYFQSGLPYDTADIKLTCPGLFMKKIDETPATEEDRFYLNMALQIPGKQTYVMSVFGRGTKNQDPGTLGGGMIVLITLLVLVLIVIAIAVFNHFNNGIVVRWLYVNIPFLNPVQSGAYKNTEDGAGLDALGGYGTNDSLN